MMPVYSFSEGDTPLLVSIPHSGEQLPGSLVERMTESGRKLIDTDWHIPRLYSFVGDLGASVLSANFSRYLVDLNRPADGAPLYTGQSETEICPTSSFMDQPLYLDGQLPDQSEITERVERYWQPYHCKLEQELVRLKDKFGYALLWDAHSIQSRLPRFFEGRLPDLNLGTASAQSCSHDLSNQLVAILESSRRYKYAYNGRFKGGYITRHYGDPEKNIHAVQMEIAQTNYMSEYPKFEFDLGKARSLQLILAELITRMLQFSP